MYSCFRCSNLKQTTVAQCWPVTCRIYSHSCRHGDRGGVWGGGVRRGGARGGGVWGRACRPPAPLSSPPAPASHPPPLHMWGGGHRLEADAQAGSDGGAGVVSGEAAMGEAAMDVVPHPPGWGQFGGAA